MYRHFILRKKAKKPTQSVLNEVFILLIHTQEWAILVETQRQPFAKKAYKDAAKITKQNSL